MGLCFGRAAEADGDGALTAGRGFALKGWFFFFFFFPEVPRPIGKKGLADLSSSPW